MWVCKITHFPVTVTHFPNSSIVSEKIVCDGWNRCWGELGQHTSITHIQAAGTQPWFMWLNPDHCDCKLFNSHVILISTCFIEMHITEQNRVHTGSKFVSWTLTNVSTMLHKHLKTVTNVCRVQSCLWCGCLICVSIVFAHASVFISAETGQLQGSHLKVYKCQPAM